MDIRTIPQLHRKDPKKMVEISLKYYEDDFLDRLSFLNNEMSLNSLKNLRDLCQYFDKEDSYILEIIKRTKIKEIEFQSLMTSEAIKELFGELKENKIDLIENILNKTGSTQGLFLENNFDIESKIESLNNEDKELDKKIKSPEDSDMFFNSIESKKTIIKAMYLCLLSKNISSIENFPSFKSISNVCQILTNINYKSSILEKNKKEDGDIKVTQRVKSPKISKNIQRMEMKLKRKI